MEPSPKARRAIAAVFLAIAIFQVVLTYAFYFRVLSSHAELVPFLFKPLWVLGLSPATWLWEAVDLAAAFALFIDSPAVMYIAAVPALQAVGRVVVELLRQAATEPDRAGANGMLIALLFHSAIFCYAVWLFSNRDWGGWSRGRHLGFALAAAIPAALIALGIGYKGVRFMRFGTESGRDGSVMMNPSPCGLGAPHYMTGKLNKSGGHEIWLLDDPVCPSGTTPRPILKYSSKLAEKFGAKTCYCVGPDDKPES